MMNTVVCILFAGAPGSSKTPIANFLSTELGLPIFSSDAIRTEIKEDLLTFDIPAFDHRREARQQQVLDRRTSFIYDASIDRSWSSLQPQLDQRGYRYFIISLDFSPAFLEQLYTAKGYTQFDLLPGWISDHEKFISQYHSLINLRITDATFRTRLELARETISAWLTQ